MEISKLLNTNSCLQKKYPSICLLKTCPCPLGCGENDCFFLLPLERNVFLIASKYFCNRRKPPRKQPPLQKGLGFFSAPIARFLGFNQGFNYY